jgi:hypothetical protein
LRLDRWFRRHQRILLAILVVLMMASFGTCGVWQDILGSKGRSQGTIRGERVTETDLHAAALPLALELGLRMDDLVPAQLAAVPELADLVVAQRLAQSGVSPEGIATGLALIRDFESFVFSGGRRADGESEWRFLVLWREAQAAGVQVTQDEVNELLHISPALNDQRGFNQVAYQMLWEGVGLSQGGAGRALRELAEVAKLISLRRESVSASTAELWTQYAAGGESLRVRFIGIDALLFAPFVQPTEDELRAFYAEHSKAVPDPDAGQVGYMAPERVKVEYAMAPMERIASGVKVGDDEVAAYYAENKDRYLVKVPEPDQEGKAPALEQGEPQEAAAGQPPKGFRHQTLEEVRDQVRQELERTKARQEAERRVREVMGRLDAARRNYIDEPLPLAQMARGEGLDWVIARTDAGKELLSARELAAAMPDGQQVAGLAFSTQVGLYDARDVPSAEVPLVFQVLERRPAELQPFEQAKEEVERDWRRQAALKDATVFAEKVKESAAQLGLQGAADAMSERLRNLLKAPAADEGARLVVQETGFFGQSGRQIPGLDGPHPALADKAFELVGDEVGVAAEGPPVSHCYVLQVSERQPVSTEAFAETGSAVRTMYLLGKQSRAVQDWMAGLLAAAERAAKVGG